MKNYTLLAAFAVCAGNAVPVFAQSLFDMNSELRNNACQYKLWEEKEGKPVGVAGTGYIARGIYDENNVWLIHPAAQKQGSALARIGDGNQKVQFMTVKNREYMVITAEGVARRWAFSDADKGFFFEFKNVDPNWTAARQAISNTPSFSLMEGTKGEYASSAPDGLIRRWSYSTGNDQRYHLQRVNCQNLPSGVPAVQKPINAIPAPQSDFKMGSLDISVVPARLPAYVVGTSVISSLVVDDSRFSNKMEQWSISPFYVLVHSQYYDRGPNRTGGTSRTSHPLDSHKAGPTKRKTALPFKP